MLNKSINSFLYNKKINQNLILGGKFSKIYSKNKIYLDFKYRNKYILNIKYLTHDILFLYNILKNLILKQGKLYIVNDIKEYAKILKDLNKNRFLKYYLSVKNKWQFGFFSNNIYLKKNQIPSLIFLLTENYNYHLLNELSMIKKPILGVKNLENSNNFMFYYNIIINNNSYNSNYIFLQLLKLFLIKSLRYKHSNFYFKLIKKSFKNFKYIYLKKKYGNFKKK